MYDVAKLCSDKPCESAFQKSLAKQKSKEKKKHQSGHSTQSYWNGLHLGSSSYSQNQT